MIGLISFLPTKLLFGNKNASKIIPSKLDYFEAFLFIRDHGGI